MSYQGVSLEVSPEERRRFDSHGSFARHGWAQKVQRISEALMGVPYRPGVKKPNAGSSSLRLIFLDLAAVSTLVGVTESARDMTLQC